MTDSTPFVLTPEPGDRLVTHVLADGSLRTSLYVVADDGRYALIGHAGTRDSDLLICRPTDAAVPPGSLIIRVDDVTDTGEIHVLRDDNRWGYDAYVYCYACDGADKPHDPRCTDNAREEGA